MSLQESSTGEKALKRRDYHTSCHDCGRFLIKRLWVSKKHPWKEHALCAECLSQYDYY